MEKLISQKLFNKTKDIKTVNNTKRTRKLVSFILLLVCAVTIIPFAKPLQNTVKKIYSNSLARIVLGSFEESGFMGTGDILLVGSNMKYSTISDAVSDAKDGDTVFVLPGIYIESVKAANKTINIVGADKNKCILSYPNGDYHNPPLEMGSGFLANMTIRALSQIVQDGAVAKAYCMHTDFNISNNNVFMIEKVSFVNDDNQVVGIGLRKNFKLHFKDCEFICRGDNNAFYCHDDPINPESKNQTLIVEGCLFVNYGNKSTILLKSQEEPDSEIICMWKNNILRNNGNGETLSVVYWKEKISENRGWLGMSCWNNTKESSGNEHEALNAGNNS